MDPKIPPPMVSSRREEHSMQIRRGLADCAPSSAQSRTRDDHRRARSFAAVKGRSDARAREWPPTRHPRGRTSRFRRVDRRPNLPARRPLHRYDENSTRLARVASRLPRSHRARACVARAERRGGEPPTGASPGSAPASAAARVFRQTASAEAAESVAKDGGDDASPEMFDNLANIFLKRDQEDWIGLLASSERWPTLRDGFFARLKDARG